ncbi:unnamed protein product [Moneuplotes crassus]|uniref:TRP C-terminal domain-containing protein n=1 Tax=Euplotes crassus TaxID=5936 RepID=A0AAD1XIL2_EUPCR|nr:unnamed protein product [Moneuplotes crassus]
MRTILYILYLIGIVAADRDDMGRPPICNTNVYNFTGLDNNTRVISQLCNGGRCPCNDINFTFPDSPDKKPSIINQGIYFTPGTYLNISSPYNLQYGRPFSFEMWIFGTTTIPDSKFGEQSNQTTYFVMEVQYLTGSRRRMTALPKVAAGYIENSGKFAMVFDTLALNSAKQAKKGWNKLAMTWMASNILGTVYHSLQDTNNAVDADGIFSIGSHNLIGCSENCGNTNFILHSLKLSSMEDLTITPLSFSFNPYSLQCGDGKMTRKSLEQCDDGDIDDDNGCDSACMIKPGYNCTGLELGKSICKPICGDGVIISPEICDDNNSENNDGCNSGCQVEEKYVCTNSTPKGLSICNKCKVKHCAQCDPMNYEKCVKCEMPFKLSSPTRCYSAKNLEISKGTQQMSSSSQAVSGVSAGATIGVSILNLSSVAAIWSIVNQLQLYLLLLLTKTPFPDNVRGMILSNQIFQFNLNFIPVKSLPKVSEFADWIDVEQENIYLETIGIESKASLLNNFGFAVWMVLLITLYPLVMTLKLCINYKNEKKCSFNYVMIKIVDLFNFIIYIRLILGGFQLLLVCSLSEAIDSDFSSLSQIVSLIFSYLVLIACISAIGMSFYIFYSKREFYDPDKYYKLGEFITGIQNSKFARLYPFMSLTRRTLFVGWLIIFSWFDCIYLSIGMLGVQIVYLVALAVIRPFDRLENNLIELVNEVIYTSMLSIMIACNREEEWSGSITSIFCGIILFNSLIITFIMIGALLVSLCKKCFSKKGTTQTPVQPVQDITMNIRNTRTTHRIESDTSGIRMMPSSNNPNMSKLFEEARKKTNLERRGDIDH